MSFENLPLHDATLYAAHISWEAARCNFRVHPVGQNVHWLIFEGFTHLEFPRHESWGPSVSINGVKQPLSGVFEIELQSGDVLRVEASNWSYRAEVEE